MSAVWPEGLPCPSRLGYSLTFGDGRIGTANETGPPRSRLRFSNMADVASMSIAATQDQYQLFKNFYKTTVKGGTLPFWMADRLQDGNRILDSDGNPILDGYGKPLLTTAYNLYKFGDPAPQVTSSTLIYKISFTLLEMP
ncbi:MAG: hypothetical protein JWR80_157 [Bradyrhizobium sp.]|nr:hypothetical protein [Bradyrhizobium sp.]